MTGQWVHRKTSSTPKSHFASRTFGSKQPEVQRSQFAPRPFAPVSKTSQDLTPEDIADNEFQENKQETVTLKIQEKHGTITPEGQERLDLLQAKMDGYWVQRKERTQPRGFDLAKILIHRSDVMPSQPIQAKLTVGAPGDKYEQEADAMASQVMSMPDSAVQREMAPEETEEEVQTKPLAAGITPLVQREAIPEEEEVQTKPLGNATIQREGMSEEEEIQTKPISAFIQREISPQEESLQTKPALQRATDGSFQAGGNIESQLNTSKGGGSPLGDEVRAFMEPRFGTDFSQVRVHTSGDAVQMNRELGAQAFARGSDVYFGAGKSPENNELMAHELTHVVQQTGGVQSKVNRNIQLVSQDTSADNNSSIDSKTEKIQVRHPTLRQSSVGSDVLELQQKLKTQYPQSDLKPDSIFGPLTRSQVEQFQSDINHVDEDGKPLMVDGIVGKNTWSSLDNLAQITPSPPIIPVDFLRKKFALIMGVDKDPNKNPFYTNAKKFFNGKAEIIQTVHSFEGIFKWLQALPRNQIPVGDLFIVSHASADGTLSFPLKDGDKKQNTTYGALQADLREKSNKFKLSGEIDAQTVIHIKGCNIGRDKETLNLIDKAFGGSEKVTAPTLSQAYSDKGEEFVSEPFIELPGRKHLNQAERVQKFQEKYKDTGWNNEVLIKKAMNATRTSTIKFTYTHKPEPIKVSEAPFDIFIKEEAKKNFEKIQQENSNSKERSHQDLVVSRPDDYEWYVDPPENKRDELAKDKQIIIKAFLELTTYTIKNPKKPTEKDMIKGKTEKDTIYYQESTFSPPI